VIGSAGLIIPHLNWRGLYDRATTPTGALFISGIDWPGLNRMSYHDEEFDSKPIQEWWGSLILDQKDATGLLYRRNADTTSSSGTGPGAAKPGQALRTIHRSSPSSDPTSTCRCMGHTPPQGSWQTSRPGRGGRRVLPSLGGERTGTGRRRLSNVHTRPGVGRVPSRGRRRAGMR
jgi:hypothetical protein